MGWQIPIFFRKIGQAANHIQQFGFQQAQRVPHNDYVGVIAHIAAGYIFNEDNNMSNDNYTSPLSSRYASKEMQFIF